MFVIPFLSFFASYIYIHLGFYVFLLDKKSQQNRVFLYLCLSFAIWSGSFGAIQLLKDIAQIWIWNKFYCIGWALSLSFTLHFLILLTKNNRFYKKYLIHLFLYLPSLIIIYLNVIGNFMIKGFIINANGVFQMKQDSPFGIIGFCIYYSSYIFLSLYLLGNWIKNLSYTYEIRYGKIIYYSLIISYILASITNVVLPYLKIYVIPSIAPIIILIWIFSVWYAILKYQFLILTPSIAAEEIVNKMMDPLLLLDSEGNIIKINQQALSLLGFKESEVIHRSFSDFIFEKGEIDKIITHMKQGEINFYSCILNYLHAHKTNIPTKFSISILRDKHHRIMGIIVIGRDLRESRQIEDLQNEINKRMLLEEEARTLKQQMEFILTSTKINLDIIDSDFNLVYVDPEWEKIYGHFKGKKCHEYFMDKSVECIDCGIRKAIQTKRIVVYEQKLKKEGNRQIRVTVLPFKNNKGEWLVAEVNVDITEMSKIMDTLRESEERYRGLIETSPDAIFLIDLNGRILITNNKAASLFEYKNKEELMGQNVFQLTPHEEEGRMKSDFEKILKEGQVRNMEYSLIKKGGMRFAGEMNASTLKDEKGQVYSFIIIMRDITERKKVEEQLVYISLHDSLTSLYNRGYFENELQHLEEQKLESVGIIVLDIDGLKIINDTLGHEKGDKLLLKMSEILMEVLRKKDIAARVGGDEFGILLKNCTVETLENICHRIRLIESHYNLTNPELPLSISMGYAFRVQNTKSMMDLFKEADNNMYREKLHHRQSLRNAIVQALMKALEERDFITEGHAERLQKLIKSLAIALKLPDQKIADLTLLAQFHDIGKVGISDRILFKPGPLTKEEHIEMERHTEIGNRIALSSPDLAPIADWILKHHEWWDGNGYPLKLKGEEIPIESRILAITDAYDAMTSDRPYRKALTKQIAIKEIIKNAGTQFDPHLVEIFIQLINKEADDFTSS